MEIIESTKNEQIKYIAKLLKSSRARKEERAFVVEGPRMVREIPEGLLKKIYVSKSFIDEFAKENNIELSSHEFLKAFFGVDFSIEYACLQVVSDLVMKSLSDTVNPKGILAIVRFPDERNFLGYGSSSSLDADGILNQKNDVQLNAPLTMAQNLISTSADVQHPVIFLEHIQDPGNLGTIFRTAEAAGARGIVMSADTVDIFSPKVVRSTMGSIFRVPFTICGNGNCSEKDDVENNENISDKINNVPCSENVSEETKDLRFRVDDFYEILRKFANGEFSKEPRSDSGIAKKPIENTEKPIKTALFGAALDGKKFYDEIDYPKYEGGFGFLIGNEGNGLSEKALSLCTEHIKIPMEGKVESLNAAVSASILMYEAKRQRGH